jgi:GT2 family glycosyltransferase
MDDIVPEFSIIIPIKELNDYLRETVPRIQSLRFTNWELLIVTNESQESEWGWESRIRLLSSGRVGPAEKRDLAAKCARGEYLVFLDDDSYPNENLLDQAKQAFLLGAPALGGPAMTPPEDTFLQRTSGAVFSSLLTGGAPARYRPIGLIREMDDWPSVNLMIKRSVFLEIGGFDSPYWPGEDTFLCLKLLRSGRKITYVPEMIVWHHRREGLLRHARQVGAYGLHRGYFARHLPDNSRRAQYFLPSCITLLAFLSIVLIFFEFLFLTKIVLICWAIYLSAVLIGIVDVMRFNGVWIGIFSIPYVIVTHLYYGYRFLRGFTMRGELVSKLR